MSDKEIKSLLLRRERLMEKAKDIRATGYEKNEIKSIDERLRALGYPTETLAKIRGQ